MKDDYCYPYDMSLREVAMCLDISEATLRQQIANMRLVAYKRQGMWMVKPEDLENYRELSLGKPGRKKAVRTDR